MVEPIYDHTWNTINCLKKRINYLIQREGEQMLFENLKIRDVNLKNRVVVSPMCQYSAKDGYIQTHHKTHYGQLAMGGAGLIFLEATGVTAQGRITNGCLGIWDDKQIKGLKEITQSIKV